MAKRKLTDEYAPAPCTVEAMRELLVADFDLGKLYWLQRPQRFFAEGKHQFASCRRWNAKFAGAEAFIYKDARGYMAGAILRRGFTAHRIMWALHSGEWPTQEIDHINGNRTDNRIRNLRLVTRQENMKNLRLAEINTSGVTGVCWVPSRNKWAAQIGVDNRIIPLGRFSTFEAAVKARSEAEQKYGFHPNHGKP